MKKCSLKRARKKRLGVLAKYKRTRKFRLWLSELYSSWAEILVEELEQNPSSHHQKFDYKSSELFLLRIKYITEEILTGNTSVPFCRVLSGPFIKSSHVPGTKGYPTYPEVRPKNVTRKCYTAILAVRAVTGQVNILFSQEHPRTILYGTFVAVMRVTRDSMTRSLLLYLFLSRINQHAYVQFANGITIQ